jgi:hypothetical protein
MPKTSVAPLYVLIIGIDEYRSPDVPNLRGARNDACAWWRFCHNRLGVANDNITVLHGGTLDLGDLVGAQRIGESGADYKARRANDAAGTSLKEASFLQVASAITALKAKLAADSESRGLIAFSGHGFTGASEADLRSRAGTADILKDLHLAPTDFTAFGTRARDDAEQQSRPRLPPVIPLSGLLLDNPPSASGGLPNLTLVIDACFGTPVAPTGHSIRSFSTTPLTDLGLAQAFAGVSPALFACDGAQIAVEVTLDGVARGAFTVALQSALDQWSIGGAGDGKTYVRATHSELAWRTRNATEAWGLEQVPVVAGPRSVDRRGFLAPDGLGNAVGASTSRTPDLVRPSRQIIVDNLHSDGFTYAAPAGIVFAQMVVTGKSAGFTHTHSGTGKDYDFDNDMEHFRFYADGLESLENSLAGGGAAPISRTGDVEPKGANKAWIGVPFLQGAPPGLKKHSRIPQLWFPAAHDEISSGKTVAGNVTTWRAVISWTDNGGPTGSKIERAMQFVWTSTDPGGGGAIVRLISSVRFLTLQKNPTLKFFRTMHPTRNTNVGGNPVNPLNAVLLPDNGTALPTQGTKKWLHSTQTMVDFVPH